METNKTILLRSVIAIGDKKTVGTVRDVQIDYDSRKVSHYVLGNASLTGASLLPSEKVFAVGDTFITISSNSDLIAADSQDAKTLLEEKHSLVGLDVFSQAGNRLGIVEGFAFDETSGEVVTISMNDGRSFDSEKFLFFSPEYVFVDVDSSYAAKFGGAATSGAAFAPEPEIEEPEISTEELRDLLVGAVLNADVESIDGGFFASKGSVISQEIFDNAEAHDALLLLTASIDV